VFKQSKAETVRVYATVEVYKGLTTLDVLAFGLIVISIFDVLLNGLRNYVAGSSRST
jgi:ABC-type bacteriocin/lantibiotic exporter with double-glycine peptidase domain